MADELRPAESATVAPPPPKPAALPPKPAAPAKPKGPTRRGFFGNVFGTWFGAAWAAFTVAMTAMTLGTVRFLFPNVFPEQRAVFRAGTKDQYEPGKVVERFKEEFGVWVVNDGAQIFALSTICTHLGCTPNWLEAEQKFKCPCHGSGFRRTGINFEGPAPRPLERYAVREEEGQIVVDKRQKFQYELGQWDNPAASVKL